MNRTPLETWLAAKIHGHISNGISKAEVREYQLAKLKETIRFVSANSPFYRERLSSISADELQELENIADLPFTNQEDLTEHGHRFLCVSQSLIERIVTLPGHNDQLRRIYFSSEDLESIIDFFQHGMSTLVRPGQTVLILMPGDRPASVGNLLVKALNRINVRSHVHGLVQDPEAAIEDIIRLKPEGIVAVPTQALEIVRSYKANEIPENTVKGVLLSSDYVPDTIVKEISHKLNCRVFSHYGTAEMGFGGAVECEAFSGHHLRDADLYIEIIDPATDLPLSDCSIGEVVFTTLTRRAMPLIRYRTGDLASLTTPECPCGVNLPRLGKVKGRIHDLIRLRTGDWLGIADLDEALFNVPQVIDFTSVFKKRVHKDQLEITLLGLSRDSTSGLEEVEHVLKLTVASEKHVPTTTAIKRVISTEMVGGND